tara:strand:- start:10542 stop:11567 length:1026 start_codon:yes stop_codon:yes gene_type:complete
MCLGGIDKLIKVFFHGETTMNYLITGGAGFIGSHLAEALISKGHKVVIMDDLSTGSIQNIAHLRTNEKFKSIIIDLTTAEGVAQLREEIDDADVIYHLAAAVGVFNIIKEPIKTIETNIGLTKDVLKFAKLKNKIVVIASTSEAYGKSNKFPFNEDDDLVLGSTKHARWSYAASKIVDEFLGLAYHQKYGLPVIITRFFNTVGPRQVGEYGMVVPRFIKWALNNEDIKVYGDGDQSRCFCNVRDVVRALIEIPNHKECFGKVFNIGSQQEITIEDLAKKTIELTGSSSKIVKIPYDQAYTKDFEDMKRRVPDTSRIKNAIGWEQKITIDDTLKEIVDWMKK